MTLANDYYDDRGSGVRPGISRSNGARPYGAGSSGGQRSARPSGARPSGARPSGAGRPGSARPSASRPASGSRQGYASRPNGGGSRPPQRRRRKPQGRFYAIIAAVVVLLVALVLIIVKPFGGGSDQPVVPASNIAADATVNTGTEGDNSLEEAGSSTYDNISALLAEEGGEVEALDDSQLARVDDLRVNTSLPSEWLNVLLLGTDDRQMENSSRTDAMIICSINRNTGEVKLASIMRDLAVEFNDIGQYNGIRRINTANYYGGPNLAMRTVNEKFNMNIQYYVMVNFFGFQRIAERLGGVEIDISQEEMDQINQWAYHSYKVANKYNIDTSDVVYEELKTYGPNTHLNGTQALAYARIRKLNGGDYMRAERQRKVLGKLMEKTKNLNALEIASLGASMIDQVRTNMEINDIINVAIVVAGNGIGGFETLQLPVNGTYKQETRNDEAMLYDCDFAANATQLYNFIYE